MPHPSILHDEDQIGCRRLERRAAPRAAAVRPSASPADRWCQGSTAPAAPRLRRLRTRPVPRARRRRSRDPRGRRRCCAGAARRPRARLRTSRSRDGEPLRTRVGQEQADPLVQPLGFAKRDVHQLGLLARTAAARPRSTWIEPDIDGQRVPDLVRDAGRHLTDGREPLLQARLPLQPLEVRDVLEGEQVSARALGKLERRNRQADVDGASRRRRGTRPRCAAFARSPTVPAGRLDPVAAAARRGRRVPSPPRPQPRDLRRGPIEREDAALRVGGHEPGDQGVDHMIVERPQVGDLVRRVLEARAGRSQPLGERPREQRPRRTCRTG